MIPQVGKWYSCKDGEFRKVTWFGVCCEEDETPMVDFVFIDGSAEVEWLDTFKENEPFLVADDDLNVCGYPCAAITAGMASGLNVPNPIPHNQQP